MQPILIVHGGAGAPAEWNDGPEAAARAALAQLVMSDDALAAAVEAARLMEDDPRFNAGTGSNLRLDGARIQMDAAVMTSDGRFGAVMALERTRNPILVARAVADTPHLMIAGEGAVRLARRLGLPDYDPITPRAREKFERWRLEQPEVPHDRSWNFPGEAEGRAIGIRHDDLRPHDTIGAIARDRSGLYAVANSTGGTTMMLLGRVGDSPIYGAGLYAGPAGAIAATGEGEEIVRRLLCFRIYQRMAAGTPTETACREAIAAIPEEIAVGVIAIGVDGASGVSNRWMPFAVAAEG